MLKHPRAACPELAWQARQRRFGTARGRDTPLAPPPHDLHSLTATAAIAGGIGRDNSTSRSTASATRVIIHILLDHPAHDPPPAPTNPGPILNPGPSFKPPRYPLNRGAILQTARSHPPNRAVHPSTGIASPNSVPISKRRSPCSKHDASRARRYRCRRGPVELGFKRRAPGVRQTRDPKRHRRSNFTLPIQATYPSMDRPSPAPSLQAEPVQTPEASVTSTPPSLGDDVALSPVERGSATERREWRRGVGSPSRAQFRSATTAPAKNHPGPRR